MAYMFSYYPSEPIRIVERALLARDFCDVAFSEPCDGFTGDNAWGECLKCGCLLHEHAPTGVVDGLTFDHDHHNSDGEWTEAELRSAWGDR